MKVPETEQYEELKTHLRYLNEKIIEAFGRFIALSTAIVGGVYYVHVTLDAIDPRRQGLALPSSGALVLVGIGTVVVIAQNLSAWIHYRKTLSECYPEIPHSQGIRAWIGEVVMWLVVVVASIGFWFVNPLR